jgi:hypothetical protein
VKEADKRIHDLAIKALYAELEKIDNEIRAIRSDLGIDGRAYRVVQGTPLRSTRLSSSGRKAISDAMKKRWAKYRMRNSRRKR